MSKDVKYQPKFCKHLVYVKDAEGSLIRRGEIVWNGSILQVFHEFPAIDRLLEEIKSFPSREDDVWFLDYVKSGSNWMVSILDLLMNNEMTSVFVKKFQGMMELCESLEQFKTNTSPRVLNTHIRLSLLPKQLFEKGKVIVMMRNPKSVAVSLFHQMKGLPHSEYKGTFNGFLPFFLENGHDNIYGTWFDYNLEVWEAFKNKQNALIVFYEELKKDPVKIIQDISDFLGMDHAASKIEDIASQTTIEKLKPKQKEIDPANAKYLNVMFRKGIITDWKNHFTVAHNEMFDALYEEKMKDHPDLKERIQFS